MAIRVVCLLATILTITFAQKQQYIRGIDYADPDEKGYNYCAYWELADGTQLYSTCLPFRTERCGRPLKIGYKCCSGFEQNNDASPSYGRYKTPTCSKMISPYMSCQETLLQSYDFAAVAPELASIEQLSKERPDGPFTVFAPKVGDMESRYGPLEGERHVVKGRYYMSDLKDGMDLEAMDGSKLHVTRYPSGVTAIDCIEVLDADLECSGGLIHKIRQPLTGNIGRMNLNRTSVMSLLLTHPETRSFAEDLPSSLKKALNDVGSKKRYTVLAPRSQSWNALRREYSGPKLQQIAEAHVLKNHICSAGLVRTSSVYPNVVDDTVEIKCEVDEMQHEKREVIGPCGERHTLVETDMTALNGVVHLIDDPILPLSVYTLDRLKKNPQCADKLKVKEFMKLLDECDLKMVPGEKYAIIMPQDESFTWWSNYKQFQPEYRRFQNDQDYRCRVARYHIVKSDGRLDNIENFASNTMPHRTNNVNEPLFETTYFKKLPFGSELNFHYSPIPNMNELELQDVSIYLTPRINVIPEKNISQIIAERPDTTITNNKTIEVEMDELYFKPNAPKNLYLVTTDDGWKDPREKPGSAGPYRPEFTMYKGDSLEKFLLLHHVPLYLWGGDIGYFEKNSVSKFMSSAGVELTFWMDENGVMRIGFDGLPVKDWPKVVKWNLPAQDGIVWLLDGPLKCPPEICPLYVEDIDFYDMYVSACRTTNLPGEPNAESDFRVKPTDVASRHPEECAVILQLSERSVTLIKA
ncbi:unnamed protein product [Calicophoron daubneyi]|uniref:FAS1 domain-containing protein n=1 Tax=Calicophoron daubneyi TaxID=300641 RepID=A0AAV2TJD6_CALDB